MFPDFGKFYLSLKQILQMMDIFIELGQFFDTRKYICYEGALQCTILGVRILEVSTAMAVVSLYHLEILSHYLWNICNISVLTKCCQYQPCKA